MSQQTESQNNSLEKTIAVTASLLYKTPAAAAKAKKTSNANAINSQCINVNTLEQKHSGRQLVGDDYLTVRLITEDNIILLI
jgi:hypothetical protein